MAVIKLQKGRQKRIEAGHPWVYRTEVEEIHGDYQPGDIIDVVDFRGRFAGRGYINPASMIMVRILTRKQEEVDREFFRRRIAAAWNYRQRIMEGTDSDSFRVIFGEADLLPGLIVDKFAGCLVVQALALGIARWQDEIVEMLDEMVKPEGIYERNDAAVRELEGLERRQGYLKGEFDPLVTIRENGLQLYVDVARGQKTGYFLDQRENRAAIKEFVRGARVLDCFCHTGSFALHAAMYGAREVLGLDISDQAVEMAQKNAALNDLGDRCSFRAGNAFDELRAFDQAGETFDTVILDPPAFTKSRAALEGAIRGYKEINLRAMRLLPPGGFLITNSCSYHLPEQLFLETVHEAARDVKRTLRLIELRRQAKDHPMLVGYDESHYLKCLILQVI